MQVWFEAYLGCEANALGTICSLYLFVGHNSKAVCTLLLGLAVVLFLLSPSIACNVAKPRSTAAAQTNVNSDDAGIEAFGTT